MKAVLKHLALMNIKEKTWSAVVARYPALGSHAFLNPWLQVVGSLKGSATMPAAFHTKICEIVDAEHNAEVIAFWRCFPRERVCEQDAFRRRRCWLRPLPSTRSSSESPGAT